MTDFAQICMGAVLSAIKDLLVHFLWVILEKRSLKIAQAFMQASTIFKYRQ